MECCFSLYFNGDNTYRFIFNRSYWTYIFIDFKIFFDGEKLKDIINYVQIGLTITLSAGYQLIGRIFNFVDLNNIEFINKWWTYILSPVWFAAPLELIINNNRERYIIVYSLMAFIIPIISIIIYIKLMPAFERNLQKLSSAGKGKKSRDRLNNFMAKIVCRTKEERNFYRFSTNMIKKMKGHLN